MKNALLAMPLLAAGAAVTAGCAASPAASASESSSTAQSSTAAASPAAASSPAGTAASPASPGACTSSDLKVSLGGGSGAGMNQDHTGLQLKNTGSSSCTLHGYPGVSWVAGSSGRQVGKGAARQSDPSGGPEKTVTLAPGAQASAPLDIVDAAVIPKSQCKPVPVRGLRVYPPGETAALFLPHSTPGNYGACSNPNANSTLTIGYMQSGSQPGTGDQG